MLTDACFFDKAFIKELRSLDIQQRHELVSKLWPLPDGGTGVFDEFAVKACLDYVADELERVRPYRRLFAAQDFDGTISIIQRLRTEPSRSYGDIVHDLSSQFLNMTPEAIRRSLELSVRLWLTFNTHSADIAVGSISAEESPTDWAQDVSLDKLLHDRFARQTQSHSQQSQPSFDPGLTAAYLVNTCGLTLHWTNDIGSHLDFDLKRLVLTVYRHKACLISHLESPHGCPIPSGVLRETLNTIDMLFPFGDEATRRLLVKEGQSSLYTLGIHEAHPSLELSYYKYFGVELGRLMEAFDKTPRTWRQLALDRRNKLQWSAFWVTVMVAVLTVVSIPCNIIQATYSVKAYHATLAQGRPSSGGKD